MKTPSFRGLSGVAQRLRLQGVMTQRSGNRLALAPLMILGLFAGGCAPARFENEVGLLTPVGNSQAEIPSGLRRTTRGWEDSSNWFVSKDYRPRSLQWWMEDQQKREPAWIRSAFQQIREVPPLMFAVFQIAAIASIAHVSRSASGFRDEAGDETSSSAVSP